MPEVILSTDDLTIFGGPSIVSLDVDFGPTGPRGSRIYGVVGDPRLITTIKPEDIQNFDLVIDVSPSSPSFLVVYQKVGITAEDWIEFTSLAPNIFSSKEIIDFTDGEAVIEVPVSTIFNLESYTADNFTVQVEIENSDSELNKPVSIGVSLSVAEVSSQQILSIAITAAQFDMGTLDWELVSGERIAHLFVTAV